MTDIETISQQSIQAISQARTSEELESVRIQYLGRSGIINQLFTQIKDVNPEKRKEFGQHLNKLKSEIENTVANQQAKVKTIAKEQKSKKVIYSPAKLGHLHPITITENLLNDLFRSLGFSIYDGPEIETDTFCFERLNVPQDHPARDMQDTIYINEPEYLLRTQTSSIESRLIAAEKPPFKTAFPGKVYRNEKVNKSNHFIFHQYQSVVVGKNITMKDLFGTIDLMFKTLYGPDVVTRYRCKYYPEVEPGVGPDMLCFSCRGTGCPLCKGAGWIEMGGAGMIHPKVLAAGGIDPKEWTGFAFGMGLDRWTMAKFGIKDIRSLLGGNLAYKPNL